jgi:flagellar export protein FliJ
MTSKRKKIQKVLELRDETLSKRAVALADSRVKLKQAMDEAERESERLQVAAQQREELTSSVFDVGSWLEAEQWLAHRKRALGAASGQVVSAEAVVKDDFGRVIAARIDKKRIELLNGRLADEQVRRELRVEQKLSDEFGQRRRDADRDDE